MSHADTIREDVQTVRNSLYAPAASEAFERIVAERDALENALREIADTPASADDDGLIAAAIARAALAAQNNPSHP